MTDIFKHLAKSKYNEKISFKPIIANMFYAGPREAMHHTLMRQRIGFQHFTIGRDHAGAENAYNASMAVKLLHQHEHRLKIRVLTHKGAVFCKSCKKVILLGDCDHHKKNMLDISGSDFRASILKKSPFEFADQKMQQYLFKSKAEIFEQ